MSKLMDIKPFKLFSRVWRWLLRKFSQNFIKSPLEFAWSYSFHSAVYDMYAEGLVELISKKTPKKTQQQIHVRMYYIDELWNHFKSVRTNSRNLITLEEGLIDG